VCFLRSKNNNKTASFKIGNSLISSFFRYYNFCKKGDDSLQKEDKSLLSLMLCCSRVVYIHHSVLFNWEFYDSLHDQNVSRL